MRKAIGLTVLTLASVVVLGLPAAAQSGHGDSAVQFRLGGFFPDGDSPFWEDTEERFTLRSSDFDSVIAGFTYLRSVNNNMEVGVNLDFYEETQRSAETGFIDEFGFPVLHDTTLTMAPLSVDVRFLPGGRHKIRKGGRRVAKPAFYLGGGVGMTFYEYEELGDFVDDSFDPAEIFGPERFVARGAAFSWHALAGVELPVGDSFSLLVEARKTWVEDELDDDFDGFGDLDLGGKRHLRWRFVPLVIGFIFAQR